MASHPTTTENSDIINLWADEDLFEEYMDQEEQVDLLSRLRSTNFESLQKTLFFRLCGLIIARFEETVSEEDFQNLIKEFTYDFTQDNDLIDKLTTQIYYIIREIKSENDSDGIRVLSKGSENVRKKLVFVNSIETCRFPNLIKISDFSLVNKIELGLYAVMLEMGFKKFNQSVRAEIENIRQRAHMDLLPVYRKGIDLVINNTIYLSNRIYGILYNKFYNRILKQFVDKI